MVRCAHGYGCHCSAGALVVRSSSEPGSVYCLMASKLKLADFVVRFVPNSISELVDPRAISLNSL